MVDFTDVNHRFSILKNSIATKPTMPGAERINEMVSVNENGDDATEAKPSKVSYRQLLFLFRELDPATTLAASAVSVRFLHCARRVNRNSNHIAVVVGNVRLADVNHELNLPTISANPGVRLLRSANGTPLYPLHNVMKWNSITVSALSSGAAAQIADVYAGLIEILFVNWTRRSVAYRYLRQILEDPRIHGQIQNLLILDHQPERNSVRLFHVINRLPNLKRLYLNLQGLALQDLPILSQIQYVLFAMPPQNYAVLYNMLNLYVPHNTRRIMIDLANAHSFESIMQLAGPCNDICDNIVRLSMEFIDANTVLFCTICFCFPSIESLRVRVLPEKLHTLFFVLQCLRKLSHLGLAISFEPTEDSDAETFSILHNTVGAHRLPAIRILELDLTITEHAQVPFLNLSAVFPGCVAIYFCRIRCTQCGLDTRRFRNSGGIRPFEVIRHYQCMRFILNNIHDRVRRTQIGYSGQEFFFDPQEIAP